MRGTTIKAAVGVAVVAVGVAATACGQDQAQPEQHQHEKATVVASTDVWGSVASAVAGDHATVNSILKSAVDDPHSFEASPADAAAITDASLVVYNGGGYDHWVDDVLANHPDVQTVNAYSLLSSAEQPANEHVFYDIGTAKAVATTIADRLAQADDAHADVYRANAAEFGKQADAIARSRSGRSPRRTPGQRSSRPNPSPITCWSTRASPIQPRRAFPALSKRTPIRHRPTSRRCSI